MERILLLNRVPGQTRLAVMEDGRLAEYAVLRDSRRRLAGNIYLARVRNTAPSLNAAFVDIGYERAALLPLNEGSSVKPGGIVIVQVAREPDSGKGPRVTLRVSLPGRLTAVTPGAPGVGVSKKITDAARRERLRTLFTDSLLGDVGWIVRTAAATADDAEILRDAAGALKRWREVERLRDTLRPPALLFANDDLSERAARDIADERLMVCFVDDPDLCANTRRAFERYAPALSDRVRLYKRGAPLFEKFGADRQADGILDRRVGLQGGGYLIVEPGETLTAIDVNSGQDARRGTERENALAVNMEAADEAARRIRLRDLGGVILIDFIDMASDEDRERVLERFKARVREDRGKARVYGFTRCGLLEMTRKKTDMPLDAALTVPCAACGGTGFVESRETAEFRRLAAKIGDNN